MIVASPPYWGLRDYGIAPSIWDADPCCNHRWQAAETSKLRGSVGNKSTIDGDQDREGERLQEIQRGSFCAACGAWCGCLGLEPTPELYVAHIVSIFAEAHRVLRADGTLWLNLGDCYATGAGKVKKHPGGGPQGDRYMGRATRTRYYGKHEPRGSAMGPVTQPNRLPIPGFKPKDLVGIPWMVAFALRAAGWYLRQDIIWNKPNPMPESVLDRCTKSHEYLFLLTKSERYYYDAEAIKESQSPTERARRLREQAQGLDTIYNLRRDQHHGQARPGLNGSVRSVAARQALAVLGTRNRRSVWSIAPVPFKKAHFATFPVKLASLCISADTSDRGVCPDCGAPWRRVLLRKPMGKTPGKKAGGYGTRTTDGLTGTMTSAPSAVTLGWRPDCDCYNDLYLRDVPVYRRILKRGNGARTRRRLKMYRHRRPAPADWPTTPAIVLDNFNGAATSGVACKHLRRSYVGIEPNPNYIDISKERLSVDVHASQKPRRIRDVRELGQLLMSWARDAGQGVYA
jgi:DNA modification methylase